jgi:5-methylcytosine-specific restriction endonuclease McrA
MICYICRKKKATEFHHRFPQTKLNKKLYTEYIHSPANLVGLCYNCHHDKNPPRWSEKDFCAFFNIEPRSKSGKMEAARE